MGLLRMLKPFNLHEGLKEIYDLYLDPEYDCFFRHFEPLQTVQEFCVSVQASGAKIISTDYGFALIKYYPRQRLADISLILPVCNQGNGNGLNTMLEIGELLFKDYGANRVFLTVSADDKHTNDICEKGKFQLEAVHKQSCFYDHRLHDEFRYVMTSETYFKEYGG